MKQIRKRLTYANVMSSIAVFMVLGGAAVAATQLPRNSVGPKQLRKDAVDSSKVKDGSLRAKDFDKRLVRELVAVSRSIGPAAIGPQGHVGEQGPAGERGPAGKQGPPGTFADELPAGKTIRGSFHIRTKASSDEFPGTAISFDTELASAPVPEYLKVGDPPTEDCPGSVEQPEAEAGHLCFYEALVENAEPGTRCVFTTATASAGCGTASRFGAGLQYDAAASADFNVWGTWAVTAP